MYVLQVGPICNTFYDLPDIVPVHLYLPKINPFTPQQMVFLHGGFENCRAYTFSCFQIDKGVS